MKRALLFFAAIAQLATSYAASEKGAVTESREREGGFVYHLLSDPANVPYPYNPKPDAPVVESKTAGRTEYVVLDALPSGGGMMAQGAIVPPDFDEISTNNPPTRAWVRWRFQGLPCVTYSNLTPAMWVIECPLHKSHAWDNWLAPSAPVCKHARVSFVMPHNATNVAAWPAVRTIKELCEGNDVWEQAVYSYATDTNWVGPGIAFAMGTTNGASTNLPPCQDEWISTNLTGTISFSNECRLSYYFTNLPPELPPVFLGLGYNGIPSEDPLRDPELTFRLAVDPRLPVMPKIVIGPPDFPLQSIGNQPNSSWLRVEPPSLTHGYKTTVGPPWRVESYRTDGVPFHYVFTVTNPPSPLISIGVLSTNYDWMTTNVWYGTNAWPP